MLQQNGGKVNQNALNASLNLDLDTYFNVFLDNWF